MKKWYRIIIIVMSTIIGFSFTVWKVNANSLSMKIAFFDKVTQEDYNYLKQCTDKVAKTLDTELEEYNVHAYNNFDNENLYVTCELIKVDTPKCKVTAKYPLKFDEKMLIENDNIQIMGKIDFDGVTYTEEAIIKPFLVQLLQILLTSILIIGSINIIFYYLPKEIKENQQSEQEE